MTDLDKTSLAGDLTATAVDGGAGTVVAGGTIVSQDSAGTPATAAGKDRQSLQAGESLVIDGTAYSVERFLGSGSEAEVYAVSAGGTRYALKLYRAGRTIRKPLLDRLMKLRGKGAVADIRSHGTLKTGSGDRRYALMEWCQGGSAASHDFRADAGEVLRIVTLTARNLHELHRAGILHKDTKPENILFADNSLEHPVLSDFGISDILSPDGNSNGLQSRTAAYAAPEVYTGAFNIGTEPHSVFTPACDYYSLGMTAVALWTGMDEFRSRLPDSEQETVRLKLMHRLPVSFPESMPDPLRKIVKGLLINDAGNRWGFDEIERQLKGEDVPLIEGAGSLHIVFDSTRGKTAHSPAELARFMLEDQQLGISYLYRGRIGEWLRKPMPELETRLDEIVENRYPHDKVAGLYDAALTLDPTLPYYDRSGNPHEFLAGLCDADPAFRGENLGNAGNPVYIYCRHRLGEERTKHIYEKVSRAASDNSFRGFAAETLLWCTHETDTLAHVFSGKNDRDAACTEVPCHTPAEVLKFFSDYRIVADSDKKFVCSAAFVEMLRLYSDKDARKIEMLRDGINDFQKLHRLIIQTLNPAADISLRSDPSDPWYAMTGEGLGKMLNMAFNAYYALFQADSDRMYREWAQTSNPWRNVCDASLVELLVRSFDEGRYRSSYLNRFFKTKGSRFGSQAEWAKFCTDYSSDDNRRKYGPYDQPIAMMKTVSGFGHTPEYRFPDGTVVRDIAGLDRYRRRSGAAAARVAAQCGALHAWLAVQYQENPGADLTPKYAYEKLTCGYVAKLGECYPLDTSYKRYRQALSAVEGAGKFQPVLLLGFGQYILIAVSMLLFAASLGLLAAGVIENPPGELPELRRHIFILLVPPLFCYLLGRFFDGDRKFGVLGSLIIFAAGSGLLYLAGRWLLWKFVPYLALAAILALAAYYFFRLVPGNEGGRELRAMRSADFEQKVLEPLQFAFRSSNRNFSSSVTTGEQYYKDRYRGSLREKKRPLILSLLISLTMLADSALGWGMLDGKIDIPVREAVETPAGGEGSKGNGTDDAETPSSAGNPGSVAAGTAAGTAAIAGTTSAEAEEIQADKTAHIQEPSAPGTSGTEAATVHEAPVQQREPAGPAAPAAPEFSQTVSAADGISVSCGSRPTIGADGVFRFTLTNRSGADMVPFIVIEEPSATVASRAEAVDDLGNSYSATEGRMSVTIGGATMDVSHRDPVFRISDGQTVQGTVKIEGLDSGASRIDIRIPLREFDPDAYPYRRGYIIFKNIAVE